MTTSDHLAHLLKMLAPPFTANVKAWAWDRAKEIAQDPEHAELPQLLQQAMRSKAISTTGEAAE
ncbi:hypothetical protein [Variovorax sp. PAMC 28711]|uniref:hypothetical protein n=1 Tax=Variovorax sp. PAMC 28711 TaxID=1795631 RepID=UPI00078DCC51|nr:hypothetical protein [Variovorax sp. PAMC 28711]AMM23185.1 hypothetical protein AX767_01440 [Variovorax sp. PAMC 28711]